MNKAREKIIKYYSGEGEGELAAKLVDLAELAAKTNKYKESEFLDPRGLAIAETVVAHFDDLELLKNGGFSSSERAKVIFVSKEFMGNPVFGLSALSIEWDKRYYNLGHRDVLGAVLGVGIKRETIGDIVLTAEGAQIVCDEKMATFLLNNLVEVGSATVSIKTISVDELVQKEEKVKEIKATVSALRLDSVAAAGYGTSRSTMSEEIKAQRVKINWQEAKNAAQAVKVGDIISFRGRGRVEVVEVKGLTKKGRTSIVLRRFI